MGLDQLSGVTGLALPKVDPDCRPDLCAAVAAMPVAQLFEVGVLGLGQGVSVLSMNWTLPATFDGQHLMGGVVGTFADMAAVMAAISDKGLGSFASTTGFNVQMLAPARGDVFVAVGREIGANKTTASCAADVFAVQDSAATLVATCLASARLHLPRDS